MSITEEQTVEARNRLCNNQRWGVANHRHIGYVQQRPSAMPHYRDPAEFYLDCSAWVTTVCRWSGIPDPSGYAMYNGYGNSDTIWEHLDNIPKSEALWGDCVIYGTPGATIHIIMLIESVHKVADPWIVSQGDSYGPRQMRLSDSNEYFSGAEVWYKRMKF